jgi:hypothetical protein
MSGTNYNTTTNLGLYKPIRNMAVGQWGDLLNANADTIDALGGPTGGFAAKAFVQDTPPANPLPGQLWFDSANPQLYVWFVDPTSAQWVIATACAGSLTTDAPSDGQTYGRQNGAWQNFAPGGPYLPLTGGAVTGPLNYTATGGTTPRSAQDRAADVANVLDYGADPTGVLDSAPAFKAALLTGHDVFAPRGTYRINSQLTMTQQQTLRGQGHATILQIDTAFDHAVTTGVIVLTAPARTDLRQTIEDLRIRFVQASDIVTTATANSAAGLNTITVASAAGIVVGMSVIDSTKPTAITSRTNRNGPTTTVLSIAGSVVTLSTNIAAPGVASGDTILFGAVRSMFKTLTAGGTSGPGGTGVQYPWAIYTPGGQTTLIRNVMITHAWNGVYFRGSAFTISGLDVFAYSIGLDIDQCYNFPSLTDYRFYPWGYYGAGVAPADAILNVYYDGATVAGNFGEVDGLGAHNFQTWAGQLNLTAAWTWGEFTNLMLDGDHANLNILAAGGGGVQITSGYSSKGADTQGVPIHIKTAANFRTQITNFSFGCSSATYNGLLLETGSLQLSDCYIWAGLQNPNLPMISLTGGAMYLDNTLLDVGGGGSNIYIQMSGTATLHMSGCAMLPTPVLAGAVAVAGPNSAVFTFSDMTWNGWKIATPISNNNGATFVSLDVSSMQSGTVSFLALSSSAHFNTGYGFSALNRVTDATNNSTAFGALAGSGATGNNNTFVGATTGYSFAGATGNSNTVIGAVSGYNLTSGSNNILLGQGSDQSVLTTGANNILIGNSLGIATAATSNTINIGGVLTTTGSNVPASAQSILNGSLTIQSTQPATGAQVHVTPPTNSANGLESKIWFHGSFPTGGDTSAYLPASIRSGWSATSWTGGYLDIWLTNVANNPANDANMVRVARFTSAGMLLPQLPGSASYANDAAAATGGVAVGQLYRNGSAVMCRVA